MPPAGIPVDPSVGSSGIISSAATGKDLVITGKVRFELPEYRVKGSCMIFHGGNGDLQVDFLHSSLFGSYREDATLYIDRDQITIDDRERDVIWQSQETMRSLQKHFGLDIYPADIIALLLFEEPDIVERKVIIEEWGRTIKGKWLGRESAVRIESGKGPVETVLCGNGGTPCYIARYRYREWPGVGWYPDKIVFERKYGSERFSLTINSVEIESQPVKGN